MTDVESIGTTKVNSVSELKNLFVFFRGTNNNIVGASHNFGHSQPQPHPNRGQIYFLFQRNLPQDISHLCAQTGSHNFMCLKLGYIHMCHMCNIVSLLFMAISDGPRWNTTGFNMTKSQHQASVQTWLAGFCS